MPGTSRRDFLKAGFCSAVIGAGVASIPLISGKGVKEAEAAATHPWGYSLTDLDPQQTRLLGYRGYYLGECAYATYSAIIGQLQTNIGYPYTEIPLDMVRWGAGGVAGFGSLCGTLNGAGQAFGLICDDANAKSLISALMSWYSETALPSDAANQCAANGQYQQILSESGLTIKTSAALPSSVARANICHASVTKWCLASGFASGSKERAERCARLAGDVASKAVELLNDLFGANGIPAYTVPGDQYTCRQCHYKGPDYFAGQFTRGKMDCLLCHSELKKVKSDQHYLGKTK